MKHALQTVLAVLLVAAGGNAHAAENWALDTFCSEVQRATANTRVKANLTVHKTSWEYRHSKPGIEPGNAGLTWAEWEVLAERSGW